jgi:agmatine/peptidylarginine deiminase
MNFTQFPLSRWRLEVFAIVVIAAALWMTLRSISDSNRASARNYLEMSHFPKADSFFRFTPPTKIARLITEWEPQQALIMAVSFPEANANVDIADTTIQILEAAYQYLEIYVFCEYEHTREFAFFLARLEKHPEGAKILERTLFIDSRNLMRWVRDFGPIFGVNRNKELVAIDLVYRNLMKDLESVALNKKDSFRDFMTLQSDAMPADVVAMIEREYDIPVALIRPPISMDGGDFVSDGKGNIFVSSQTLARNGTNRQELQKLFLNYFGAKKLHILEALPGATVRHLDMILKFANEKTILLPDYKVDKDYLINPYRIELSKKVQSVLQKNESYLRKHFPKHTFLKIPMPPILFLSKDEIFRQTKEEFYRVFVLDRDLLTSMEVDMLTPTQRQRMEKQVEGLVKKELPSADFQTEEGFDKILHHFGQQTLESYVGLDAESATRYRSYINSVFLHSKSRKQAYLIPRFTGKTEQENTLLKQWEKAVESVYRKVSPNANIHWINCDSMVDEMGFLHCVTSTLPAIPIQHPGKPKSL